MKNILIVDDDYEVVETILAALKSEGFTVWVATDGNQAIAYAETKDIDLMILDIMMPRRSGFLVLERLRQGDVKFPVIIITGNQGNRHQKYAEMLGIADYIRKPFRMDRLTSSIDLLFDER